MSERWFFALWPGADSRAALVEQFAPLTPSGARPTHPLDLHLTVAFLGPLDPQRLSCAESAADALRASPVPLRIDQAGWFTRSHVLWCGPAATPEPLARLVVDLRERLDNCAIPPDPRPFRPHITLARNVSRRPRLDPVGLVQWVARELVLAAGRQGAVPRYAVLRRWPLAPPPDPGT